jgi:hypothetical protein
MEEETLRAEAMERFLFLSPDLEHEMRMRR